jgi:beta-glucosidase
VTAAPRESLALDAKIRLLTGASMFTLWPEPDLGLSEMRLSDGPAGVRGLQFLGGRVAALLPNATLLAASWSEDNAREAGMILAQEAMAQQIHVVLGPTVNLHRSPLGGRLFEAYSEDPLLTGRLAAAYVHGLQSRHIGACLKHLVANESETERNTVNSVLAEATLRELYLLPFQIAVEDSDPWAIMAAYNDVNGVPATEHDHVINEIVKGEWGYTGLVISDWFATKTAGPATNGGLDLVMPGPHGPWGKALVKAVQSAEVSEAVIDDHLERLLRLAGRVGTIDPPRTYPADLPAPASPQRRDALTRLAASGMTVLVNRDSALPLGRHEHIALIGRHAIETIAMGGGSARVNPPYQISIADGLRALLGDAVTVVDGVEVRQRPVVARPGFVTDPETGEPGAQLLRYTSDGHLIDRRHHQEPATIAGYDSAEPVAQISFRARIASTSKAEVGVMGVGQWTLRVGNRTEHLTLRPSGSGIGEEILLPPSAVITAELPAQALIEASVRLPGALADGVGAADPALYALVGRPAAREAEAVIADAERAAATADVAVVVVGLTDEQETEAADKTTLRLPGDQDELVRRVAQVAPRTVVVVNAATPVLMPWIEDVDAVLWAGLPGQEAGHAVAAALLGDIEPAGRLVTTFPAADGATPAWSVTPVDGDLAYTEGTFIGYRGHFADRAPAPAFWFGHGLGYSTWEYPAAELLGGDGPPGARVRVVNTGSRRSREVVQVYFQPADPGHPVRLVGWAALTADPGEAVTVDVATDARMWRSWDTAAGCWTRLSRGQLVVARGLGDIRHVLDL